MIQESSTDKQHVQQLVDICQQKGLTHIVVSPGSRNAPLSVAFNRAETIAKHVVVDERTAGFVALGIAQRLKQPVALLCSSGTALLNYAPAIAEAYYQQIPLLVLSADRPLAWIDQDDSQTIRQHGALHAVVKKSFQLIEAANQEQAHWYNNRLINEAYNLMQMGRPGPVHINIPLEELLFGLSEKSLHPERIIVLHEPAQYLDTMQMHAFSDQISQSQRVLVIASLVHPNAQLNDHLNRLAQLPQVTVLAESLSNLHGPHIVAHIDRTISKMTEAERVALRPDILITFGGPVLSRVVKQWLRSHPALDHWHIDKSDMPIDTYTQLTQQIKVDPVAFFHTLLPQSSACDVYQQRWQDLQERASQLHHAYLAQCGWSDLKAFEIIMKALPERSCLHLSNGTSVRYHQLFERSEKIDVYANRGVSGIDGSLSTAVGAAFAQPDCPTICITGDISFLYDSNALWQEAFPPNLKIIVMNNQGGSIFRFIAGPSTLAECERFFETPPRVQIAPLCQAYQIAYLCADEADALPAALQQLFSSTQPALLEIVTPREENDKLLRNYFKYR